MLQIIDDDKMAIQEEPRPEQSISLLLDYFIHELSCRNNIEFVKLLWNCFSKVHDMHGSS
jgi:U3 small nucleolar RNA-associated protein 21